MLGGPINRVIPKGYQRFLLHCLALNKGQYLLIANKEGKELRSQNFTHC